jgi:hypothetical protein
MFGRNFTLELVVDDEQKSSIIDVIEDASRLVKTLHLGAVRFVWGDITYTVCADGRTIQRIKSDIYTVENTAALLGGN